MLQPPTDNLYKFLAIFGLALIGLGTLLPLQRYEAAAQQSVKSEEVWAPLYSQIGSRARYASNRADCAVAPGEPKPSDKKCLSLRPVPDENSFAERTFQSVLARATQETRQTDFLIQQYTLYLWLGIGLIVVGVISSAAGFYLWYTRLQRFQDTAVRREGAALSPRRELPSTRPKKR